MKILKKLKFIIIAAGIALSAAFYVLGGSADKALGGAEDSLIIGAAGEKSSGASGTEQASAETEEATAVQEPSESAQRALQEFYTQRLEHELYIAADGSGYISDILKEELRAYIRDTIRDELVAMCEEGYIEQAVNEATAYTAEEAERKAGMVNINTADAAELTTLDGIGDKRAADIIAYRNAHGAFNTPEDIMQVNGIKQSSYDKIKDKIYT